MKKRTLGLVAGMVLVAASAGFSQATVLDKKVDANLSSHSTSEVPAILGSFNNGVNGKLNMSNDGYVEMREDEMDKLHGEFGLPDLMDWYARYQLIILLQSVKIPVYP